MANQTQSTLLGWGSLCLDLISAGRLSPEQEKSEHQIQKPPRFGGLQVQTPMLQLGPIFLMG